MPNVLYIILGIVVFIPVLVVILASTRPKDFRVERSARIQASPEEIFGLINDFHEWKKWSPWDKLDPEMKVAYQGASSGPGAVYEWSGNKKAGVGRMEILESRASEFVKIKLDFLKPFEAHNITEFTVNTEGDSSIVNWAMYGESNLMSKVFDMLMNMDKLVGKDFEEGLSNMKSALEK